MKRRLFRYSAFVIVPGAALSACQYVPGTDAKKIADAENMISRDLIDPDSAQFRDVRIASQEPLIICGEINGKNRMGVYSGFSGFLVGPQTGLHQIDPSDAGDNGDTEHDTALAQNKKLFAYMWQTACEGKKVRLEL